MALTSAGQPLRTSPIPAALLHSHASSFPDLLPPTTLVGTRHGEETFADASPDQRIATGNAAIREIASAERLPLIDLNRILTAIGEPGESATSLLRNQLNSNSADGVHPTRDGYLVIATAVFQKIQALEKTPERVLCFGDSITYGAGMQGAGTVEGETYPGMLARLLAPPH